MKYVLAVLILLTAGCRLGSVVADDIEQTREARIEALKELSRISGQVPKTLTNLQGLLTSLNSTSAQLTKTQIEATKSFRTISVETKKTLGAATGALERFDEIGKSTVELLHSAKRNTESLKADQEAIVKNAKEITGSVNSLFQRLDRLSDRYEKRIEDLELKQNKGFDSLVSLAENMSSTAANITSMTQTAAELTRETKEPLKESLSSYLRVSKDLEKTVHDSHENVIKMIDSGAQIVNRVNKISERLDKTDSFWEFWLWILLSFAIGIIACFLIIWILKGVRKTTESDGP
jgi:ABC-type transporter Mla subunit MlaD